MSNNIYVGNLSFDANESDLGNLFAQYGEVTSARIISDRYTQRSKGFGFVEMADSQAAAGAIAGLNETQWMGRNLRVNEAESRENRSGGYNR